MKEKSTNWGGLIIFNGKGATLTKIYAEITIPQEKTIWSGTFECPGWQGLEDLSWGKYDWSSVKAGTILRCYYTKINAGEWGCIHFRHGQGWAALPEPPIKAQYDFDADKGNVQITLTADVLKDLVDNGGLILTGANYTLNKVTLE